MSRKRRTPPEDVQRISAHAREQVPCEDCGAAPGESCIRPGAGRTVHKTRYIAAAVTLAQEARAPGSTPEEAAVLAGLPAISAEEINACRTPRGGYSFTREWFISHGLPYPPIAGWRRAVEGKAAMTPSVKMAQPARRVEKSGTLSKRSARRTVGANLPPEEVVARALAMNYAERTEAGRREAMAVRCPFCGSLPGDRCRSTGAIGNSRTYPHAVRIRHAGMLP